jgi:hypothetical protein
LPAAPAAPSPAVGEPGAASADARACDSLGTTRAARDAVISKNVLDGIVFIGLPNHF